jgi:hypothetical protein
VDNVVQHSDIELTERISLSLPASGNHVRVARATAGAVATRSGFAAQDIEDVRIAVTELTGALVYAAPSSDVTFEFAAYRDAFVVEAHATVTRAPYLTDMAERVLGTVVDRFELWESGGIGHFRATKRPAGITVS